MVKQTIRVYFLLKLLSAFGMSFIASTYVIFLMSKGMNLFEVNLINFVFFATLFLSEIPTGLVADVFGRKISFICSCFLEAIAMVVYAFSGSFWFFALAEGIAALARTFSSGAFQAWLVDRLKYYDYEEPFHPLFRREQQIAQGATIFGALTGSVLAERSLALPWLLGSVFALITGLLAIFLMKEEYFERQKFSFREGFRSMKNVTKRSISYGSKQKAVRFILLIGAVQYFAVQAPNMQWQPLFSQHFPNKTSLGFIYAGISISLIIGSALSSRLLRRVKDERAALVVSQLLVGLGIILAGAFSSYVLSVALFLGHEIARGAFLPIKDAYLNDNIPSKERATLISFESISHHIGGAVGLLVSGFLAQRVSISFTWIIFGLILIAGAAVMGKNGKKI